MRAEFTNVLSLLNESDAARSYWHPQPKFSQKQLCELRYRVSVNRIRKLSSHVQELVPTVVLRNLTSANGVDIRWSAD